MLTSSLQRGSRQEAIACKMKNNGKNQKSTQKARMTVQSAGPAGELRE
jgi:hypothetical protein